MSGAAVEKQPSGPYSGDTISFRGRGQEVRGWGWAPLPEVMRPRPRRSLGGGWGAAGSWVKQTEAEQERTEELLEQGSLWAGTRATHTHRHTGMLRHTHVYRQTLTGGPGMCKAHAHTQSHGRTQSCGRVSEALRGPRPWGGLATAQGLGREQVRTGQGPANRPKGG